MASANGKKQYKAKGREKSPKNEGHNLSHSNRVPLCPIPVSKSIEPPDQLSTSELSELSSSLSPPNSSSGDPEPSAINDLSDALQMTDLGGSEVEELLEQALDLNRRLKAELSNRMAHGEPMPTPEFPMDVGLDGQHSCANRESRRRIPVLPPLAQHNRGSSDNADRRHMHPGQNHRPVPTANKINKITNH